jgi:hypothetical protein
MYLEIDNQAPIQIVGDGEVVPIGGGPVKTVLRFPDGTELIKAAATAREALKYHVADEKVSGFHSDDPDLEYLLNCYFGVRNFGVRRRAPSVLGALTMAMALWAMTQFQLRYTYGSSWLAGIMGNPASTGTGNFAPGCYLGISQDPTAPVAGDTSLVGEMSPLSTPVASTTLARTLATFGYTPGATTYTESNVFTSDCTVTIYKSALFITPSGGQPIFGKLLQVGGVTAPETMRSGDEVGVTETVSFT